MKIFKYVFVAAALGLTVTSCADMDLEPKGLLYDNVLMSSDNGIQKYWFIRICRLKTLIMVRMVIKKGMLR